MIQLAQVRASRVRSCVKELDSQSNAGRIIADGQYAFLLHCYEKLIGKSSEANTSHGGRVVSRAGGRFPSFTRWRGGPAPWLRLQIRSPIEETCPTRPESEVHSIVK